MKRAPLAALLIAIVTLALPACSQNGNTQAGTAPGETNSWTRPGVLRWAGNAEPDNMDPVVGNQQIEVDLSMFWAGYLFNWTDQNELLPELATQVPTLANGDISSDGLAITYHLRRGVKWQDGAPFTADDVIYTYQQVTNPQNFVGSTVGYDSTYIKGITKVDDFTIVVHLVRKWAPFVNNFFTMGSTPYPILPKHILDRYPNINKVPFDNLPVGTGPFKVVEYEKGSLIKMVANPSYWRGPPKLKEVDYEIIPDENTILTQLESHDIDFEYYAPASQAVELNALTGYRIFLTPFTQYAQVALNLTHPPLDDLRVRQALAYATDVRSLIHDISHDVYVPGYSDQPSFLWAANLNVPHYDYNTAKAGALLDAAGWTMGPDGYRHKNGETLELTLTGEIGRAEQIQTQAVLQSEWKLVGVKVDIKNYQSGLYFATYGAGGTLQTGKFDTALLSWINGIDPDDSTLFMCNQFPVSHGQNIYHFCDHDLDAAESQALDSYDPAVRKAAYYKIQDILAQQEPMIITWFVQRQDIANTDLKNYKPAHAVTTFWNTWEWQI
ncbi:MAG TPA: peptide ABC transporter substrate-binding protein [Candidatus Eremiobacteraceae bacterium]|nr:peptide ABC transporter substrate-binding protein [Candidatus Eremiobacteraceae bacterium]